MNGICYYLPAGKVHDHLCCFFLSYSPSIHFINEFYEYNSDINGTGGLQRFLNNYPDWLKKLEEDRNRIPNEEKVPAVTYFLVRENDNRIIGMINIRLALNERLRKFAGHIGFCIRPTERRKGYNKINLYLILKRCSEIGLDEVLLDCSVDNPGSYKTMESLGGFRIDKYYNEQYGWCYRYSINVLESVNKYRDIYEPWLGHCLVKKGE